MLSPVMSALVSFDGTQRKPSEFIDTSAGAPLIKSSIPFTPAPLPGEWPSSTSALQEKIKSMGKDYMIERSI